jgi:hypothetical protein
MKMETQKAVVALLCCLCRYVRKTIRLFEEIEEEDVSMWHPGTRSPDPRVVLMLRSGRPSHGGVGGTAVREFWHSDVAP